MIALLILRLLFAQVDLQHGTTYGPAERCMATTFCYRGDRYCGGRTPYLGRRVRPDDWGVAQRWKKLGTWVQVCNLRTGRCTYAPRIDAGPWMRKLPTGERYNAAAEVRSRTLRPGRFIGCIDLTPPVAAAIGADGWDPVTVRSVRLERVAAAGGAR